ncbi:MAG: hypothetical protein NTW86_07720 [Candidatus Sumerlaeota bacterium]|nr:hypothetical protein [Candidatus Sumerlaeota bacterium]
MTTDSTAGSSAPQPDEASDGPAASSPAPRRPDTPPAAPELAADTMPSGPEATGAMPSGPQAAEASPYMPPSAPCGAPAEWTPLPRSLAGYWMWAALLCAGIAYAVFAAQQIGNAYVDFGDGNYHYIASRLADGLVPYRDIMAPQPPLHLVIGSWLVSLGGLWGAELHVVRLFSILLRLATALIVGSIARYAFRSRLACLLAGAAYLFLPNGLIWNLGYQSEPLEIFFLALMIRLALPMGFFSLAGSALFGCLAVFTNMTAAPYAVLVSLWLVWRRKWLALAYIIPLCLLVALGVFGMEAWTGGHYLENVFINQVGTFPKTGLLHYVADKLSRGSQDIALLEGLAVAGSLVGIGLYWWRDRAPFREFLALFALASLGSIVFVAKGGTEQYIFTLGEPYVAVFFAFCLALILRAGRMAKGTLTAGRRVLLWLGKSALAALLAAAFAWQTQWNLEREVIQGGTLQLKPERVEQVCEAIKKYSAPREAILAPPFFAFLTRRTLAGEYSELFIYHIGYLVEQDVQWDFDLKRKPMPAHGPFTRKTLEVADMLERQKIPLVILDLEQPGLILPIVEALTGIPQNRIADLQRAAYSAGGNPDQCLEAYWSLLLLESAGATGGIVQRPPEGRYRPLTADIYWTRNTPRHTAAALNTGWKASAAI